MKKNRLIAFIALGLAVASCGSDDSAAPTIMGKWYYQEYRVDGEVIPYEDHESCGKDYIEFQTSTQGRSVDVYQCAEDSYPFTYTLDNSLLTIIEEGYPTTGVVQSLTNSTLEIAITEDFDDDGTDDQVVLVYTRS